MMKTLAPFLALPLAACISFGAKPPPSLLAMEPAAIVEVGKTQSSSSAATITIAIPSVPQELATARVPVRSGGTAIAYLKNAQWVEVPSRLFARVLADTITANTGRVVLSNRQSLMDPGARLTGELRIFGIDADTNEAVAVYDASLIRGDAAVFEKRRFEVRVPVAQIEPITVGSALSHAANQVAVQVAEWVGRGS